MSTPALDGKYSLQLLRNNSAAWAEIRQSGTTYFNLSTAFYSFEFQYGSQTGEDAVANFEDNAGNVKAALHLGADGKLRFYDASSNLLGVGVTTLNPNQTYSLSATIGTGSSAPWEVRINGVIEMTSSTNGTANLGNPNGAIKLGGDNLDTANYYYDDVAISPNVIPAGGLVVLNPSNQTGNQENLTTSVGFGFARDWTPQGGPLTVNVNWGDGSPNNKFTVMGLGIPGLLTPLGSLPHVFQQENNTVTVTVTNQIGVTTSGSFQVTAIDPPVLVSAQSFTANTVSNQLVGNFLDPAGADSPDHYGAIINWGDGTLSMPDLSLGRISQVGSRNLFAVYGDHAYTQSGSYPVMVTIEHGMTQAQAQGTATISPGAPAPSTTLNSTLTTAVAGQSVTFTATVTPRSGTPTGTVSFFDTINNVQTILDTVPVSTSGGTTTATLNTGLLVAGSNTITAQYEGDGTFTASLSAPLGQTVNQASTNLTLSSSAIASAPGQSVTFTATVSVNTPGSTQAGNPTGTVIFSDNGTSIGQGTLSTAGGTTTGSFTTSTLTLGTHPITASYTGDSNFTASASGPLTQTVQQPVPLVQAPSNQTASEGWTQSFSLGSFSEVGIGPWTAMVDWGDGTTTTLQAPSGPGSLGNQLHHYGDEGVYTVTVTVNDTGANTSGSATFKVTVYDWQLAATSVGFLATAGAPFSGPVATFTDPGGVEALDGTHYSASIDWGDGTAVSTGTVSYNGTVLLVNGTHTYAAANNYILTVTIVHDGWLGMQVQSYATVSDLSQFVSGGLVKPTSFWEGLQGQQLIRRFGLTSSNQTLGQWLATTFPNLYGGAGGAPNLSTFTDYQVGSYYQSLYLASQGTGLDVEILDTALDLFTTTSSLGGTVGQSYGFTVNSYGLGAYSWNIASSGAAFGTPNNSVLNVFEILLAANNNASGGEPWGSNMLLRNEALTVFQGITAA